MAKPSPAPLAQRTLLLLMRGDSLSESRCEPIVREGFSEEHLALSKMASGDVEEIQYSPKYQDEEKEEIE